jgi:hypothetical protein
VPLTIMVSHTQAENQSGSASHRAEQGWEGTETCAEAPRAPQAVAGRAHRKLGSACCWAIAIVSHRSCGTGSRLKLRVPCQFACSAASELNSHCRVSVAARPPAAPDGQDLYQNGLAAPFSRTFNKLVVWAASGTAGKGPQQESTLRQHRAAVPTRCLRVRLTPSRVHVPGGPDTTRR